MRLGTIKEAAAARALTELNGRVFTPVSKVPARERVEGLASRHSPRGADLWHVALSLDLQGEEPSLRFLTFHEPQPHAAAAAGLPLAVPILPPGQSSP